MESTSERRAVQSTIRLDDATPGLSLTFSLRSILIWTTVLAVLLGGYVRWHWISFAFLAAAMPVGGLGIALVTAALWLASRDHSMRATVVEMLAISGFVLLVLSLVISGLGVVLFLLELSDWVT